MLRTPLVLSTIILGVGIQTPMIATAGAAAPAKACIVSRDTGAKYCLEAGQRSGYSLPSYIRGHDVDVIAPEGLGVMLSDWDNLSYNRLAVFERHTHNEAMEHVLARNGRYLDFSNPRSMRVVSTAKPDEACIVSRQTGAEYCLKAGQRSGYSLPYYIRGHQVDVIAPEGLAVMLSDWDNLSYNRLAVFTKDTNNEDMKNVRAYNGRDIDFSHPRSMRVLSRATVPTNKQLIQDFNDFTNQLSRGSWGLVDFDNNGQPVTEDDKDTFVEGREILFQVKWTERTLRGFLGDDNFESLKTNIGVDEIRSLVEDYCPAKLEVGTHRTYGRNFNTGYTSELDSDTYHCQRGSSIYADGNSYALNFRGNASTVIIESFLPTVPGATYELDVDYQKRNYNTSVNPDQAFRELVVQVSSDIEEVAVQGLTDIETDSHTGYLPINKPFNASDLDGGFAQAKVTFKADRFYTPISLKDTGHADSYGILVTKVVSDETMANPFEVACQMFHPNDPELQKECLTSTGKPTVTPESCDLSIDESLGNFVVNKPGYRAENEPFRYVPQNIFHHKNYYSVGKGGVVTLNLAYNGVYSGCDVQNRTLSLDEFTGNNWDFQRFAEQGLTKVLLACEQDNETVLNWETLETTFPDNLLITNHKINKTFNDDKYSSCKLRAIRFVDRTHKIPSYQPGYSAISDGFDIRNLKLN